MKSSSSDNIDDLLQRELSDYEAPVGDGAWEAIKDSLDGEKKGPSKWIVFASWLGFVLLCLAVSLYVFHKKTNDKTATKSDVTMAKTITESTTHKEGASLEKKTAPSPSSLPKPVFSSPKNKSPKTILPPKAPVQIADQNAYSSTSGFGNLSQPGIGQTDANSPKALDNLNIKPKMDFMGLWTPTSLLPDAKISSNPDKILAVHNEKKGYDPQAALPMGRLWIGLDFAPEFNMLKTTELPGSQGTIHQDYLSSIGSTASVSGTGLSGGIRLGYRVAGNFCVRAGISYFSLKQSVHYDYKINNIPVFDSASGKIIGYIPDSANAQHVRYSGVNSYDYISIPLEISYAAQLWGKFSLQAVAGANLMLLTGASGQTVQTGTLQLENLANLTGIAKSVYAFSVSAGLAYAVNNKVSVEVTPQYHQWLNSLYSSSSGIDVKATSLGLRVGVKYKI